MIGLKINDELRALIPPLSEAELKQLEENILKEGVRDPLCVWNGVIIDGHHRYKIAKKHKLDFQIKEFHFDSVMDAKLWMIQNQLGRRNLNKLQAIDLILPYKDVIANQIKKEKHEKSFLGDVELYDAKEVTLNTRERIVEMAQKIAGGGKIGHGTVYHLEEAKKRVEPEVYRNILNGKISLGKVSKELRKEDKLKEIAERHKRLAKNFKGNDDIQIHCADFYKWCMENIEPGTIDLILTDPPYPKEYLHVWEQLSEVGKRVLKPGGYLVTYSGQLYLNKVIAALDTNLDYCWSVALHHSQNTQLVTARTVVCTWKPLLIYRNGAAGQFESCSGNALVDSFMDDFRDKDFHEWGQGHAAVAYLMRVFSEPRQTVLEPFAGGGTTLAVAKVLNRKCIGVEIDENYIDIIKANILQTEQKKLVL